MKLIIIFFICLNLNPSFCWAQNKITDVIEDPVISRRCKSLLRERTKKISIKQRLSAMILRNSRVNDKLKLNQQVAKQKLDLNRTQIENNLKLTQIRIKAMEEDIIRKGCPGITL